MIAIHTSVASPKNKLQVLQTKSKANFLTVILVRINGTILIKYNDFSRSEKKNITQQEANLCQYMIKPSSEAETVY